MMSEVKKCDYQCISLVIRNSMGTSIEFSVYSLSMNWTSFSMGQKMYPGSDFFEKLIKNLENAIEMQKNAINDVFQFLLVNL